MFEADASTKTPNTARTPSAFEKLLVLLKKEHKQAILEATRAVRSENASLSEEIRRLRHSLSSEAQGTCIEDSVSEVGLNEVPTFGSEMSNYLISDPWLEDPGREADSEADPQPPKKDEEHYLQPPSPVASDDGSEEDPDDMPPSGSSKHRNMSHRASMPAALTLANNAYRRMTRGNMRGSLQLPIPESNDSGPVKSASFTLAPAPTPPPRKKAPGDKHGLGDLALPAKKTGRSSLRASPCAEPRIKTPPPKWGVEMVKAPGDSRVPSQVPSRVGSFRVGELEPPSSRISFRGGDASTRVGDSAPQAVPEEEAAVVTDDPRGQVEAKADSSSSDEEPDEVRKTGKHETSDELEITKSNSDGPLREPASDDEDEDEDDDAAPLSSSMSLPASVMKVLSDGSRSSRRSKGSKGSKKRSGTGEGRSPKHTARNSLSIPGLRSSLKKEKEKKDRSTGSTSSNVFQTGDGGIAILEEAGGDRTGERRVTLSMMSDDSEEEDDGIQLWPCWQLQKTKSFGTTRTNDTSVFLRRSMQQRQELFIDDSTCNRVMKRVVVSPSSARRLLWDVFGMILIGYDLVVIPLQAFNPPANRFIVTMTWVTIVFWTLDIPLTFVTGYHSEGVLEMCPKAISRHYLRTWFTFDITVIVVDWLIQVAGTLSSTMAGSSVAYMRIGRTLRFLRLLRLVRLVKVHGVLSDLMERVNSEFYVIILGIGRLVLFILMLNHIIACAWYAIGSLEGFQSDTWVIETLIADKELGYRYATSLHWSLTQFTPASMEVVPHNTIERVFCVMVLVFAMVTFSSFISSITNAMTQLRNLNSDKLERFSLLRRFLGENKISATLCARIWGCLQQVMDKSKRRIHEEEVPILQMLPWSLKADLQEEIFGPQLTVHPFFIMFAEAYPSTTRKIYQNSIAEVSLGHGQELFGTGEVAGHMYFSFHGMMAYNQEGKPEGLPDTLLIPGQWASEACLWIKWNHCGQMIATTHCELMVLHVDRVQELMKACEQSMRYARRFAAFFKMHPDGLSDVFVDVWVLTDIAEQAFNGDPDPEEVEFQELKSNKSMRSNGAGVLSREFVDNVRNMDNQQLSDNKFSLAKMLSALTRNNGILGRANSLENSSESESSSEGEDMYDSSANTEDYAIGSGGISGRQSYEPGMEVVEEAEELEKVSNFGATVKPPQEQEDRVGEMPVSSKKTPPKERGSLQLPIEPGSRRSSGLGHLLSGALGTLKSAVVGDSAGASQNHAGKKRGSKGKRVDKRGSGERLGREERSSHSRKGSKEPADIMKRRSSRDSLTSRQSNQSVGRRRNSLGSAGSCTGSKSGGSFLLSNFFKPKESLGRNGPSSTASRGSGGKFGQSSKLSIRNIFSASGSQDLIGESFNPTAPVSPAMDTPQITRKAGSSGTSLVFS